MALYEELRKVDVLSAIFNARGLKLSPDENGDLVVKFELVADPESPWLHHHWTWERRCDQWTMYFNLYKVIPRGCRACWKVVMNISSLEQLFDVYKRQADFGSNCKCGIETRAYTGGLGSYRAYFYTHLTKGLEGGRELKEKVKRKFPEFKCYLKRGCTEMENFYSPSDKWDMLAEKANWNMIEDLVNAVFRPPPLIHDMTTPPALEVYVMKKWIEYAFEHGDKTYKLYADKKPVPEPVKYDGSIHSEKDFIDSIYEPIEKGASNGLDNNGYKAVEEARSTLASADGEKERGVSTREGKGKGSSITIL